MRIVRGMLFAVGTAIGAYGALLLIGGLEPVELLLLAVWLAAVVAVHDGVLVPVVSTVRAAWLRGSAKRPIVVTALAQVGFVVGGVLTLFVVPEVWAQSRGTINPTILVGDYAGRLLAVWVVIAIVVLIASRVLRRRVGR